MQTVIADIKSLSSSSCSADGLGGAGGGEKNIAGTWVFPHTEDALFTWAAKGRDARKWK